MGSSAINIVCRESKIKLNVTRITDGIISTGLEVKLSDTVRLVKSMIDSVEETSSDEYQLIFDGNQLDDDMTIGGCGLTNDSILYLVLHPVDTFPLRIAMPCGRVERIPVKPLHTIFDLKVALQKEIEMPINQWHLALLAKVLEDIKTVASCGLEADSLLHVMLPSVQILVRIRSGMQITVFIKLTDDVESLKEKIFEKAGYPVKYQTLMFAGKILGEGRRLITYGIKKSSTVHLSFRVHYPAEDYDV